MNIMYITDVGFDSPNGTNRLIISMINEFLNAGHSVYMVQSHSTGIFKDLPVELRCKNNFYCDTINKKNVDRGNFVKRYLNGIKFEFDAKKKWKSKVRNMDIVLVQSCAWSLKGQVSLL